MPSFPPPCRMYTNIFTESKYNGESLTTWEPRGKEAAIHVAMSKLVAAPGQHPYPVQPRTVPLRRPGIHPEMCRLRATGWARRVFICIRFRIGTGRIRRISPTRRCLQWNRDWIWYEAWARYSWNPDIPETEDHAYWISRLAEFYGNTNAAEKILDAYNNAGEVAPRLIRRFGITEGNRQTLSLGMTLDELVNPEKYKAIDGFVAVAGAAGRTVG